MSPFNLPDSGIENCRSSKDSLEQIKERSDENLEIIRSNITTLCENQKRDIIVNLISILDYYIHDIIIWGILEITENQFPKGKKYKDFEISIEYLRHHKNIFEDNLLKNILKNEITGKLCRNTYQKWDSIREGLKIILPHEIDKNITELTGTKIITAKFNTDKLETMNNKRNSIVHTFDRNLHKGSIRNNFILDCQKKFDYISLIIESIHNILIEYEESQPENNEKLKIQAELGLPKTESNLENSNIKHNYFIKALDGYDIDPDINLSTLSDLLKFIFKIKSCENNDVDKKLIKIIYDQENTFISAEIS